LLILHCILAELCLFVAVMHHDCSLIMASSGYCCA
jgi:hypothetical protein